jgi:DNA-directed RNA polymerase specialized sigma24 family protein
VVDLTGQLSNPQPQLRHLLDQGIRTLGDPPHDEEHPSKPTRRPEFQTQRRLKPHQVAELAEAYRSGKTMKELASAFGIHRTTVTAHLHEQGVSLRGAGQLDAAEVARLYEEGWSSRELGETFGVSANTVLRFLRQTGVPIRPPRGGLRPASSSRLEQPLSAPRVRAEAS